MQIFIYTSKAKFIQGHKMCNITKWKLKLDANGQNHLYKFWNQISAQEKIELSQELDLLPIESLKNSLSVAIETANNGQVIDDRMMCPDPSVCGQSVSTRTSCPAVYKKYIQETGTAIKEHKVAVVLLAGGLGTRLGATNPKGMYNIGLPSGRSLYQLQAERLLKLCNQVFAECGHEVNIPWYIMTSDETQTLTEKYFKDNNYFGYSKDHIIFFEQFTIPVLDFDGKILMKTKSSICLSPEGNGGLYRALYDRGILHNMASRGVEYVHIVGVDNVLIKMADPAFLGYCISMNADCGVKVVEKTNPTEPIGVVGVVDGLYQVVEYSELSLATSAQLLPVPARRMSCLDGHIDSKEVLECNSVKPRLLYCLGNICNHFMTLQFLERVCRPETESQLAYHVARKKVPFLDVNTGQLVQPSQPNALKLEKFVFDVFRFSNSFFIWEVDREVEFSPLKNIDEVGKDCPSTCRSAILKLHAKWVREAGAQLASPDLTTDFVEVSPFVSLDGEKLDFLKGKKITGANRLELLPNEKGEMTPTLMPVAH